MIENPQSFIVSTECRKAVEQHGFRRRLGEAEGWAAFQSTTAQGTIWLAAKGPSGPWFLALDHAGVVAEIGLEQVAEDGPGLARFRIDSLTTLYAVMPRVYELAVSLPDAPLQAFVHHTRDLPRTTEAERLVVQRIGQDIFRERLIDYWQGRCPLTGITDRALLRASHIKPWKDCKTDDERLDVHNGLLLSALWDAAFDGGLVTFDSDGRPLFGTGICGEAENELRWQSPLKLTGAHKKNLSWHREFVFVDG